MTAVGQDQPFGSAVERIPDNLLREPLDYMLAEHFRQRKLCTMLEALVADSGRDGSAAAAAALIAYLRDELPLHIADEETDLFPILRESCQPSDNVETVLRGLIQEHETQYALATQLVERLLSFVEGGQPRPAPGFEDLASEFLAAERRHFEFENNVVLPLARRRLGPLDLQRIGRAMAARRGITYPD
jgi:hemerythrin-like domain-containing protein